MIRIDDELSIKGRAVAAILWYKNPNNENREYTEEILMTQRHTWMRIFPGYHAFPGGKIEPGEEPLETLKREIQEEVGVDLDVSKAIYHGIATTPRTHPYRYQTHYYSLELTLAQKTTISSNLQNWVDHPEFASFEWNSAQNFLKFFQEGYRLMVPLVRFFLKEIAAKGITKAKMLDANTDKLEKIYFPLEMQSGIMQLFIPSKTLPPQKYTNCFLINAETEKLGVVVQKVFMIDPSPLDEQEWNNMIHILEEIKIQPDKIICTHHHIDHCSFLHKTANHFKVPVLMHRKTFELAHEKNPVIWNSLLPLAQWVDEWDVIGSWKNKKLLIQHVPGHAAGQIAITAEDGAFYIANDLFQSEGSVVIGGRGSSMSQYMETLVKVLKFKPAVLYPSHGIPVGSLNPLNKILKHRLQRHVEVAQLQKKGLSVVEITKRLYIGLPENLFEYAVANVESHLAWLEQESLEVAHQKFCEFLPKI